MLLPRMNAPASVNAWSSAWCFSGSSDIQWWRKFSGMSPKGFSKLWLDPATKAFNDIVMPQVTLFMRFSPLGDHLNAPFAPPPESIGRCDGTGGVTPALSQRIAPQRLILAQSP